MHLKNFWGKTYIPCMVIWPTKIRIFQGCTAQPGLQEQCKADIHLDVSARSHCEEEWCVCWLLLEYVSFHPAGDDLTASPQSEEHWGEWGWMALSVKGDHHSLPFHGSASVWDTVCLKVCMMVKHCVTPLTTKLSSCFFCLQAGKRGDCIRNWDKAAGGEDWAP